MIGVDEEDVGHEFKDVITALKGICVRSFPEVLVDVQTAAIGSGREVGTSVAPITRQVSHSLLPSSSYSCWLIRCSLPFL